MRIPVVRDESGRAVFDEQIADYVREKLEATIGPENVVEVRFDAYPHERFVTVVVKPIKDAEATRITSELEEELNALDPDITVLCLPEQPELSPEEALKKWRENLEQTRSG